MEQLSADDRPAVAVLCGGISASGRVAAYSAGFARRSIVPANEFELGKRTKIADCSLGRMIGYVPRLLYISRSVNNGAGARDVWPIIGTYL